MYRHHPRSFLLFPCLACAPLALILAALAGPPALAFDRQCAPAVTACTSEEIEEIPVRSIANTHWQLQVTPSGYSDFGIFDLPPFPRRDPRDPEGPEPLHEMFSGEWAAAVAYEGMSPVWLEKCFRYPEWKTNSDFQIVQEPIFDSDPDGDGLNEGSSIIRNDHLEITVRYDFENTGTGVALGRGGAGEGGFEMSNPFVLHQSYELRNITGATLSGVSFYKLSHPHPANTETPSASVGYDDTPHADGALQDYRWDLTGFALNSGLTDGFETGSLFDDHVGLSVNIAPADWGLGSYRGHLAGDKGLPEEGGLKPVVGEHCDIEAEDLANETVLEGDEVAASLRFDLGSLAPDEVKTLSFLLAFQSRAQGIPAEDCLRVSQPRTGDLSILIEEGACAPGEEAGPYDVVLGSLHDLAIVPECGEGFDCTRLINLRCLASGHGFDRLTLTDDAHRTDSLFYLVRPSARFTDWGSGNRGPGSSDLLRLFFTPSTAPGIDACDVIP